MYLLLWCQCPCFKWKKNEPLCFVLCTQDCWKSKGIPFLWLTQLKSSCHSNMRSQLSWFCFILNKLFLLRKMVFLPGSELTTNVWPLCLQQRGTCCCCCCCCSMIVAGLEQEAGRLALWRWPACFTKSEESSWLSGCGTPLVCGEGGHLLLYSSTLRGSGADAVMQEAGKHPPASQNGVQVWGFDELEFLNFMFLICFVHPTCLALVLIFFFLSLKKFEIALNLARKPLHQIAKRKSEMSP